MTGPGRVRLLLAQTAGGEVGPADRALWELATRLPESRYEVSVWLSRHPAQDALAEALEAGGIPVGRPERWRSRWDLRRGWRRWSELRRLRPDLVHLQIGAARAFPVLPGWARLGGGPPLVVSQQGAPGPWPWGALREADAFTVPCGSVGESLAREQDLPRDRIRVVPGGADLPDPEREIPAAQRLREEFGAGPFRPLWVCPARLEPEKGHDVLLDALARLAGEGLDFVVALAGSGSLGPPLERSVERHGLAGRVRFTGDMDGLGALLLAADSVALPSRDEALPLSLLEAMARSRAVVATRVGGVPEVLEDGVEGLLVPPGDAAGIAAALRELHQKPDRARQMGLAAGDRVREGLTWRHAVERFEAVYDEVLGLAGFTPAGAAGRGRGSRRAARSRRDRPSAP